MRPPLAADAVCTNVLRSSAAQFSIDGLKMSKIQSRRILVLYSVVSYYLLRQEIDENASDSWNSLF